MADATEKEISDALRMGISMTRRKDYANAIPLFTALVSQVPPNRIAQGLSYYGLCLEMAENKTRQAVELCRKAIEQNLVDGEHHVNLARVYLHAKDEDQAVLVIEEGLKRFPKDNGLLTLKRQLNIRPAPLTFLHRKHRLNLMIQGIAEKGPIVGLAVALIFLAVVGFGGYAIFKAILR